MTQHAQTLEIRRTRSIPPLLVLLTASTGCAMTVLDTNIVAMVLPTIARDFGASFADIQWVVSAYVLCFASLLLPAGAISDRFGRKRVFLCGIGVFILASLVCGLAPSPRALYLARAFQGMGAAFLLAPALAIIGHTFHKEAERNRAWAIWGGIMGLTMVLSPVLGGFIDHYLGWRWAFFVNIPICTALGLAVMLFITESHGEAERRLDPPGIILFTSAMFGLTWGLVQGQAQGWTAPVSLTGFAIGLCALLAFIRVEGAQRQPMLDVRMFRDPRLVGGVWAMFAYATCAQVMASLLPLLLLNGLGRAAVVAGFSMLPFALAMLVFPYVGRYLARFLSSPQILVLGMCVTGAGNLLAGLGAQSASWALIMPGMVLIGSGGGLLNGETQKAIMSVVPRERAGMASGLSTTARMSGILLGFAVLSGILATMIRAIMMGRCEGAQSCANAPSQADAIAAGDWPQLLSGLSAGMQAETLEQARLIFAQSFSYALFTAGAFALISALAIHRLLRTRPPTA